MTEVQLHHLHKRYDHHTYVVSDLSLVMPCRQITALLGPSGCGKTTILKMIAGLLPPTGGDISFDGQSVLAVPPEKRGAVLAFQNHLLFPTMNVFDNVAFGLKMRGENKAMIRQRVEEMLELVKLSGYGRRQPHQLSGGQKQRVALARALIVQPRVLLLDEPLSNLDAHLRQEMRDLIFTLQRQMGITTIVVTHDQEEAVILADRIALIFDGRLQQVGTPDDFYERPLAQPIARFFGGVNFIPGIKQEGQVQTGLGTFRLDCPHTLPDGPVHLTIRPENIQLRHRPDTENSMSGQVLSHVYAGAHTRFKIATADPTLPPLEVVAHVAARRQFSDGQELYLYFPPPHIWLLPANGAQASLPA